jgi:hypothetical protein
MMTNSILPLTLVLLGAVTSLGCIGTEGADDETESVATAQQPAITANAITANAITANAITANAITANAITANAITANAITANAITANALTDPNARELFKYMVSCALPSTASVDLTIAGVDYSFPGELSLAPKWGLPGGSCNTACQEWVSACVLARIDYLGQKVNISLRGANAALTPSAAELATYTYREGTYYGNLFLAPQVRDACVAPGRTGLPRVCGPSLDDCVVDTIGSCGSVCEGSAGFGSFMNCADHAKVNGHYPAGTKLYPTAITVFLDP